MPPAQFLKWDTTARQLNKEVTVSLGRNEFLNVGYVSRMSVNAFLSSTHLFMMADFSTTLEAFLRYFGITY